MKLGMQAHGHGREALRPDSPLRITGVRGGTLTDGGSPSVSPQNQPEPGKAQRRGP